METMRLILVVALALVSIMIWQAWQQDYGPARAGARPGCRGRGRAGPRRPGRPAGFQRRSAG